MPAPAATTVVIVRNVEQTDEADLPEAVTRIADVDAKSPERFLARLKKQTCFLLHLSEGVDQTARKHFRALRLPSGEWAITSALAGIHCAGLLNEDFKDVRRPRRLHGVVADEQSPALRRDVAREVRARATACGSASAPTGRSRAARTCSASSRWLRLASDEMDAGFSDRDLVAMATRDAASILGWSNVLGLDSAWRARRSRSSSTARPPIRTRRSSTRQKRRSRS